MAKLDSAKIISKFNEGKRISVTFHFHNEKIMRSIEAICVKILARYDLIYLIDSLVTVLREIVTNAIKANSKRYYFKQKALDINDPASYQKGIANFKDDIMLSFTELEDELNMSDYYAKIKISKVENKMRLEVDNNVPIHPVELERINSRIAKAKKYQDFTEAYDEIYDDTEGAGLGLVLTLLLLKNTGIGADSFSINSDDKLTTARVDIPFILKPEEITTTIKVQIINEIKGLPTFHENIISLQEMCKDPDAIIETIVKKIMVDPALMADIFKLSNSAYFSTGGKIKNLNEAIMRIGLKNLHDVLIATGARRILEERYPVLSEIWAHCNKVAIYASYLADNFRLNKIREYAFLSGLLHDLGKIVLLATDQKFTSWISDLMENRKIRTSTILEEITLGISHSAIGELMAEKWKFPNYLQEAIKNHHSPLNAKDGYRDLVYVTYLANMICGLEARKYHFFYLEDEVLKRFNIYNETDLNNLKKRLAEHFKKQ